MDAWLGWVGGVVEQHAAGQVWKQQHDPGLLLLPLTLLPSPTLPTAHKHHVSGSSGCAVCYGGTCGHAARADAAGRCAVSVGGRVVSGMGGMQLGGRAVS